MNATTRVSFDTAATGGGDGAGADANSEWASSYPAIAKRVKAME